MCTAVRPRARVGGDEDLRQQRLVLETHLLPESVHLAFPFYVLVLLPQLSHQGHRTVQLQELRLVEVVLEPVFPQQLPLRGGLLQERADGVLPALDPADQFAQVIQVLEGDAEGPAFALQL